MEHEERKPVRTDVMDVSPEMQRLEAALWRAMTPEQRIARLASQLDLMREWRKATRHLRNEP